MTPYTTKLSVIIHGQYSLLSLAVLYHQQEILASARNASAWSTKPTSVKYSATSATDQLEASGGSDVNVADSFGRVTTASTFDGGDLIDTKILHSKETTIQFYRHYTCTGQSQLRTARSKYCHVLVLVLVMHALLKATTLCPQKSEPPKHFATAAANLHRFK